MAVFSDAALDAWLQSGGTSNAPISQRRHSLSDAMAVFGLRSTPRGLQNYSTTSAQLRSDDGAVVIDLASDQITVTAPNVVVNCSEAATVTAPEVILGTASRFRDFLLHTHTSGPSGSPTGPVL